MFECGRAQVHNLRNSLNAAALGLELLGDGAGSPAGDPARVNHVREQLGVATAEIEALQALILEAAQPKIQVLSEAAAWALRMTGPVARRRAIDLVVPNPVYDLPALPVPEGFCVALCELLITACLASDRGAQCTVTGRDIDGTELIVEWTDASGGANSIRYDAVEKLVARVLESRGRSTRTHDGALQRLAMNFDAVS
jgi:hypothetical protein